MLNELLIQRWKRWMEAQSWSPRTVKDRVEFIAYVHRVCGKDPAVLGVDDVQLFLSRQTFGAATRRRYWLWLRSWFVWLNAVELRDDNPTDRIPKPKAGRRKALHLTTAHIQKLLAANMRKRTRTMILLGLYQGYRAGDIAQMHTTDIDLIGGTLHVIGKGDVEDYLPLHPVIAEEAEKYRDVGYWFPGFKRPHVEANSVSDVVGDVMRRAGVPGTTHSLRRWYAMELLRQGVDLRVIQRLMRHVSLATTEQYLFADETDSFEAVSRLPRLEPYAGPVAA